MRNLITILINLLVVFVVSVHSSSNITLCDHVSSTWSNFSSVPDIVVIREHHLEDIRMISALDDADCWIKKNFKVNSSYTIKTKLERQGMCYSISTIGLKVNQLLVVISEGQSAQNCTPSIYGPIPNILNVKMFVDGTKNSSVRRMELSFRNPGGHLGVQFELHRPSVVRKIQKTIQFMLELNSRTHQFSELTPFWKPTVFLPPSDWQYFKRDEENKKLEARNLSISWVLVISTVPMLLFGVIVSCYIVIQPRGGLTYTDEEVDFTIQEVDSASRVNMIQPKHLSFKTAPISYINPTTSSSSSSEGTNTAMEPTRKEEIAPKTAIPLDKSEVHTDPTMRSEIKSTKTVRLPATTTTTADDGGVSAETLSLRTGRD